MFLKLFNLCQIGFTNFEGGREEGHKDGGEKGEGGNWKGVGEN